MEAAERLLGVESLYTDDTLGIVHMLEQAIRAHHFYKCDDEYMVRDGEVPRYSPVCMRRCDSPPPLGMRLARTCPTGRRRGDSFLIA